jgi:hypothetical protein
MECDIIDVIGVAVPAAFALASDGAPAVAIALAPNKGRRL